MTRSLNRRHFLVGTTAATSACLISRSLLAQTPAVAEAAVATPWLRKTLKIGMIQGGESLAEKFAIAKEAGFEGVELNVPLEDAGVSVEEAVAAAKQTGLIIDGTVGGYHWAERHTDPDPEVRKVAQGKLESSLRQTAAMGGKTMLLVPGHAKDGTQDEVLQRAADAVKAALPVAEEVGVTIVIENVWNEMFYDIDGGTEQSADALASFIDRFDSPWVGVQYDIGNHWRFGDPAQWVRTLDKRITKLDIKGFSRPEGKFTKITEGDIDWPSVETALRDIKFTGWLAAEVTGGDLDRLKEVNDHLEEALHCSQVIQ